VTTTFTAGPQQPTSAAPKYDCSKRSTIGQLGGGGKTVTFPGISRLATGHTLSVVILPGSLGLERLVFSAPDATTLSLLDFSTPATSLTPTPVPTPSLPTSTAPRSGSVNPVVPLPPISTLPPSAPQPIVATPSATAPALATVAASRPDDHRERIRALGMLVALVGVTGWLTLTERRRRPAQPELGVGRFRAVRTGPPPTI
jgi:hypothetical protein